jgi:ring-1,2-phenylacetyl-CoA epoxidase subunit PaaD
VSGPFPGDMTLNDAVGGVLDPEIDVTLAALGVVRSVLTERDRVVVTLAPTRIGCPALGEIGRRVRAAVHRVAPGVAVQVEWLRGTWRPEDVSGAGIRALTSAGYRVAGGDTSCPYCLSDDVTRAGRFGGGVCRTPFSCRSCGSSFDLLGTATCGLRDDIT